MEVEQTFQTKTEALNFIKQLLKDGISYLYYKQDEQQIIVGYDKETGYPFLFDFLLPILNWDKIYKIEWVTGTIEIKDDKKNVILKNFDINVLVINSLFDEIYLTILDLNSVAKDYFLIEIKAFPDLFEAKDEYRLVDDDQVNQILNRFDFTYDINKSFGLNILPRGLKAKYTQYARILAEKDISINCILTYLNGGIPDLADFALKQQKFEIASSNQVCLIFPSSAISNNFLKNLFITKI
jgi:hypothetical protein